MVLRGLTTLWSLATFPTRRSPFSDIATTEGRISAPLSLGTTLAILLRTNATHVLVVPRSIPSTMGLSATLAGMLVRRACARQETVRDRRAYRHPTRYRTSEPASACETISTAPTSPDTPHSSKTNFSDPCRR